MLDIAADEAASRGVDAALVTTLNGRDVDQWVSCFASDAKTMPPGAPPVDDKEAIRNFIGETLEYQTLSLPIICNPWKFRAISFGYRILTSSQ